ncbi:MAG: methyltransferase [Hyphomonadaceae bacterium]|nr:methyltransferase [Hyphomonadaceae bacterium]
MREWRDETQRSILDLAPQRLLEIGCGTGMVLFSVLDEVDHYSGIDVSANALSRIGDELTPTEASKVDLRKLPADAIGQFETGSFDTVVINSVAQYFPSADYLADVLERASALIADGGQIFVGDVRSLEQQAAFHTAVELNQAPAQLEPNVVSDRIEKRIQRDSELVLGDDFFHALVRDVPRLQGVTLTLKRGASANEMTDYRYDVVLHVGSAPADTLNLPAPRKAASLADIRDLLASGEPVVAVNGVPNARLAPVYAARQTLTGDSAATVGAMRDLLSQTRGVGIDPGELFELHPDYLVASARFNRDDASTFDVVFRHKTVSDKQVAPRTDADPLLRPADYANQPAAQVSDQKQLTDQLRAHLREHLPDYMVPSAFVAMDTFPLTPNGKIDRKALPAPTTSVALVQAEYVPPSNDLENTIAEVWKELLGLSQVGRTDNIFDIGANSIMTAQANQRLSKTLGRRVSLVSMFRYPTVETLAAHLGSDTRGPAAKPERAQKKTNRREEAAAKRRAKRQERVD